MYLHDKKLRDITVVAISNVKKMTGISRRQAYKVVAEIAHDAMILAKDLHNVVLVREFDVKSSENPEGKKAVYVPNQDLWKKFSKYDIFVKLFSNIVGPEDDSDDDVWEMLPDDEAKKVLEKRVVLQVPYLLSKRNGKRDIMLQLLRSGLESNPGPRKKRNINYTIKNQSKTIVITMLSGQVKSECDHVVLERVVNDLDSRANVQGFEGSDNLYGAAAAFEVFSKAVFLRSRVELSIANSDEGTIWWSLMCHDKPLIDGIVNHRSASVVALYPYVIARGMLGIHAVDECSVSRTAQEYLLHDAYLASGLEFVSGLNNPPRQKLYVSLVLHASPEKKINVSCVRLTIISEFNFFSRRPHN